MLLSVGFESTRPFLKVTLFEYVSFAKESWHCCEPFLIHAAVSRIRTCKAFFEEESFFFTIIRQYWKPQSKTQSRKTSECYPHSLYYAVLVPTRTLSAHIHSTQITCRMSVGEREKMHRTSHIIHMNDSFHTYEWVMSHVWMSHVTHMNESCHTYEWVMSHR